MCVKLSSASSDAESKPTWPSARVMARRSSILCCALKFGGPSIRVGSAAATGDSAEWAVLDDSVRCRFAGPGLSSLAGEALFFGESELMLTVKSGLSLVSRAWLILCRTAKVRQTRAL